MIYAVIKENKIINAILADSKEDAELATELTCVDVTNKVWDLGWDVDGETIIEPEVTHLPPLDA